MKGAIWLTGCCSGLGEGRFRIGFSAVKSRDEKMLLCMDMGMVGSSAAASSAFSVTFLFVMDTKAGCPELNS